MPELKMQHLIEFMRREALFRAERNKISRDPTALLNFCIEDQFLISSEENNLIITDLELNFEDVENIAKNISKHEWINLKLVQIGKMYAFRNNSVSEINQEVVSKIRKEMRSIEPVEKEEDLWRRYALKCIYPKLVWTKKNKVGRQQIPWADAAKIIISSIQENGGFTMGEDGFIATGGSARNVIRELVTYRVFEKSELGKYLTVQTENQRFKGVEEALADAVIRIEQWVYSKTNGAKEFVSESGQRDTNLAAMKVHIFNADDSINPTSPELLNKILISQ